MRGGTTRIHGYADRPKRIDALLSSALDEAGYAIGRKRARKFIEDGLVRVDGRLRRMSSEKLGPGGVEFAILMPASDLEGLSKKRTERTELGQDSILHRGDDWVALEKPSGIPSDRTKDPRRETMVSAAERLLGTKVWAVHRLDRDTSGVLVMATSKKAAAALGELFRSRDVRKTYKAVVSKGAAPLPAEVNAPLADVGGKQGVRDDGKPAQTELRVLEDRGETCLIEAKPLTGRTHQIRAHLAHVGWPIAGDVRYGGSKGPRVMLHAQAIELQGVTIVSQTEFATG